MLADIDTCRRLSHGWFEITLNRRSCAFIVNDGGWLACQLYAKRYTMECVKATLVVIVQHGRHTMVTYLEAATALPRLRPPPLRCPPLMLLNYENCRSTIFARLLPLQRLRLMRQLKLKMTATDDQLPLTTGGGHYPLSRDYREADARMGSNLYTRKNDDQVIHR